MEGVLQPSRLGVHPSSATLVAKTCLPCSTWGITNVTCPRHIRRGLLVTYPVNVNSTATQTLPWHAGAMMSASQVVVLCRGRL